MKLYCANCGKSLTLIRKALPKYGVIIDCVAYHECDNALNKLDIDLDIRNAAPAATVPDHDKFVKSLNELNPLQVIRGNAEGSIPKRSPMIGTDDLRDRRQDVAENKSSAPSSVLSMLKGMQNTSPEHEIPSESED